MRAGGFHRDNFTVDLGITQKWKLYPTIFNVVVDAVAYNWLNCLCGKRTVYKVPVMDIIQEGVILYAYDGWLLVKDG